MWKLLVAGVILAGAVISYAAISGGDSDVEKSAVEQQSAEGDTALEEDAWNNAYCPNALPADENPYLPLQIKYSREGNNRKEVWADEKGDQYSSCAYSSHHLATAALRANQTHQNMLKSGTPMEIDATSKASTLAPALKGSGKYIQQMARRSYDLAYARASNRLIPADREAIMRKTFCECLTHPMESYLKND